MHDILPHANQHCVAGCADNETAQHLLLSCPFFAALWGKIRYWLGVSTTEPLVCQLIFISLFIQQVDCVLVDLLCSLFGCVVCGLCGVKETIESSKTRRVPSISW